MLFIANACLHSTNYYNIICFIIFPFLASKHSSPLKLDRPKSSLDATMSMLNEVYQSGQEALNEGLALFAEVSGNNSTDYIMGDETSHRKRGPDAELRRGGE
jgi:hypothetical protein